MALIPPFFLDAVVAIGTSDAQGNRAWVASGFLYGRRLPGDPAMYSVFLVTNRHVVQSLTVAFVRFNPQGLEPAREFPLILTGPDGTPMWQAHPREEIDVAVTGLDVNRMKELGLQFAFFQNNDHAATVAELDTSGVTEGDGVFVLGFPMGLVGEKRSAVVARSGCVARIRELLQKSADHFLIDASVYPGNSGGPVISRPEPIAIVNTKPQGSSRLLGVVRGYIPYRDVAVSAQTGQTRVIFEENSGLAAVHPVDSIEETIDQLVKATEAKAELTATRAEETNVLPAAQRAGGV